MYRRRTSFLQPRVYGELLDDRPRLRRADGSGPRDRIARGGPAIDREDPRKQDGAWRGRVRGLGFGGAPSRKTVMAIAGRNTGGDQLRRLNRPGRQRRRDAQESREGGRGGLSAN